MYFNFNDILTVKLIVSSLKNYSINIYLRYRAKKFKKVQCLMPVRVQQMSKSYWIGPMFIVNVYILTSCSSISSAYKYMIWEQAECAHLPRRCKYFCAL